MLSTSLLTKKTFQRKYIEYFSLSAPPIAEKKEMKRIVRLGSDVKLICPVSAIPAPMFEWFKDGEVINNYAWARYARLS